ncbi:MAG: cytochrome b N-terminal domain-containing protein [Chloroflexi bacterium]|nr:cytochrome b N-terminal domain-containing protein [Chloroflexota bacterium]
MQKTVSRRPADWINALIDWMDERVAIRQIVAYAMHVSIPRSAHTFYLGGITLFFFIVQAITGILLALYYHPTPEAAYDSILFIMNDVNFGWLVRSAHAWGANLMIVFCVLHLLRVVVQGAYRAPREMTWLVGIGLLLLTLGFGFTGYLLPWDERAFWATTVGTQIAGSVPLIGNYIQDFLRGGPDLSALTLSRFFDVHVLILPLSLAGALGIHLLFIHQQGLADPEERDE